MAEAEPLEAAEDHALPSKRVNANAAVLADSPTKLVTGIKF